MVSCKTIGVQPAALASVYTQLVHDASFDDIDNAPRNTKQIRNKKYNDKKKQLKANEKL